MEYIPERIVLESGVEELPFTRKVLAKFPDIEPEVLEGYDWKHDFQEGQADLTRGKKTLFLKAQKGEAVKLCPGFSEEVLCCNYWVMNFIENCPFECTYCILQAFHNRPLMTLYANVEEIVDRMKGFLKEHPDQYFRIGTGEHSDSLVLDQIFPVNEYLIEQFADIPNAILELKTKSADIDHLLGLQHKGNTILAWSLNPEEIIKREELKTADLNERISAAKQAQDAGYKLAFHFDPLIYHDGWKEGYRKVVEKVAENLNPEKIVWFSTGALRYIPALKQIAETRFPRLSIFSEEFVSAPDGKMRYLKNIRYELFKEIHRLMAEKLPGVPHYLCMEQKGAWKYCMETTYESATELDDFLSVRCRC